MVRFLLTLLTLNGLPGGTSGKNPSASAGDIGDGGSILSKSLKNGKPFQHSSLENPMDRGAWWVTFHRVTKSPAGTKAFWHTDFEGT